MCTTIQYTRWKYERYLEIGLAGATLGDELIISDNGRGMAANRRQPIDRSSSRYPLGQIASGDVAERAACEKAGEKLDLQIGDSESAELRSDFVFANAENMSNREVYALFTRSSLQISSEIREQLEDSKGIGGGREFAWKHSDDDS